MLQYKTALKDEKHIIISFSRAFYTLQGVHSILFADASEHFSYAFREKFFIPYNQCKSFKKIFLRGDWFASDKIRKK